MNEISYVAAFIAGLPILVGLVVRAQRTRAALWLMLWCAVILTWNIIGMALGSSGTNNLWVEHSSIPMELVLLGAALAHMLPHAVRHVVAWAAGVGIVLVLGIALFVEDLTQFPALTSTIRSILVSSGAAYLLITRSATATTQWTRDGGRLVAAGLLVGYLPTLTVELALRQLMSQESEIVFTVLGVRSMFWIAGISLIALGMRWHSTMPHSGSARSPLHFSPSRS